jgi:hypothetical protein
MSIEQVAEIEYEIKSVDVVLRLLRADSSAADALESKLAIQKHIRHIEGIRARLRRSLFAAMDEAESATATVTGAP